MQTKQNQELYVLSLSEKKLFVEPEFLFGEEIALHVSGFLSPIN